MINSAIELECLASLAREMVNYCKDLLSCGYGGYTNEIGDMVDLVHDAHVYVRDELILPFCTFVLEKPAEGLA